MKRPLFLALAGATAICGCANQSPSPSAMSPVAEPYTMPGTSQWDMTADNGRTYRIFVSVPDKPAPAGGYPVFYLVDGNIMFGTAAEAVRAFDRRRGIAMPPAIVVGIGYPTGLSVGEERRLDLTPRVGSADPKMPGSGGAEEFAKFVAEKLKPEIARRWPVDSDRETLFGHSFGGLFTLYTLVNDPALFDVWVAASPSLWFENKMMRQKNLRKRLPAKLAATGATPRVLITVGQYEQAADPDFPPRDPAGLVARGQITNAREFSEFLDQPGVAVTFREIAGEDHGTVIPAAISRAVRFAFSPDQPPEQAPMAAKFDNPTSIPVPTAQQYVAMTAKQRYDLRTQTRRLPKVHREKWTAALDRELSAGLTYLQHRLLHEERVEMDHMNGTHEPAH